MFPECLETIGDHIRAKRLHLSLYQHQVAERMDVSPFTIINWEQGETTPSVRYGPKIIEFLGYDPTPEPETFADRVSSMRWTLGLTQRQLADELGIHECTVRSWERGENRPSSRLRARVEALVRSAKG